jgi:hypothetical protein
VEVAVLTGETTEPEVSARYAEAHERFGAPYPALSPLYAQLSL